MKVSIEIQDLSRIQVRPGDRFVYRVPEHLWPMNLQQIRRIEEYWLSRFPDNPLTILPPGDLIAVSPESTVDATEIHRAVVEAERHQRRRNGTPSMA